MLNKPFFKIFNEKIKKKEPIKYSKSDFYLENFMFNFKFNQSVIEDIFIRNNFESNMECF